MIRARLQAWWRRMRDRLSDGIGTAAAILLAPAPWDGVSVCAHAECALEVAHDAAHVCGESCGRFFCFAHLYPIAVPDADGAPRVVNVCMECLLKMQRRRVVCGGRD